MSEQEARTAAQRKISSQILDEIYLCRGEAARNEVAPGPTGVDVDARGRALVDVRGEVTPALEKAIRSLGGVILSTSLRFHSIEARVPVLELEQLAADDGVRFIEPVARAATRRPN